MFELWVGFFRTLPIYSMRCGSLIYVFQKEKQLIWQTTQVLVANNDVKLVHILPFVPYRSKPAYHRCSKHHLITYLYTSKSAPPNVHFDLFLSFFNNSATVELLHLV